MTNRGSNSRTLVMVLPILAAVACSAPARGALSSSASGAASTKATGRTGDVTSELVMLGRQLVINRACGDCHGGNPNPAAEGWLAGRPEADDVFPVGPFKVWARNLTPDDETGLGRVTERQIFNALRYGLRPKETPDVEITSANPGEGNHPMKPSYLAPAMPWMYWRFMTDEELWAIAAYLKHGVKPVRNEIPASEAPPDRWASEFTLAKIGSHVLPDFPTQHEELRSPERQEQVLRGRALTASTACSGCHGGAINPAQEGWFSGMRSPDMEFTEGPYKTRPRNLTPDNTTGMGRFSERQIFNALRYGLRPGETPDIEITSTVPGKGNHPANPKYLAPPMPWPAWRHLANDEIWAIAAYLKYGVKPVRNRVPDSEGPPDFWASRYTAERYGTYPAPAFPTARERQR